jgi:hypothetical protein
MTLWRKKIILDIQLSLLEYKIAIYDAAYKLWYNQDPIADIW